jgi:hypothetical protein
MSVRAYIHTHVSPTPQHSKLIHTHTYTYIQQHQSPAMQQNLTAPSFQAPQATSNPQQSYQQQPATGSPPNNNNNFPQNNNNNGVEFQSSNVRQTLGGSQQQPPQPADGNNNANNNTMVPQNYQQGYNNSNSNGQNQNGGMGMQQTPQQIAPGHGMFPTAVGHPASGPVSTGPVTQPVAPNVRCVLRVGCSNVLIYGDIWVGINACVYVLQPAHVYELEYILYACMCLSVCVCV